MLPNDKKNKIISDELSKLFGGGVLRVRKNVQHAKNWDREYPSN